METSNAGLRRLDTVRRVMAAAGAPDAPTLTPFVVNGVAVGIRTLTAERIAALCQWADAHERNEGNEFALRARFVAASVVDAEGDPLLTPADALNLPERVFTRLWREVVRLNKF